MLLKILQTILNRYWKLYTYVYIVIHGILLFLIGHIYNYTLLYLIN